MVVTSEPSSSTASAVLGGILAGFALLAVGIFFVVPAATSTWAGASAAASAAADKLAMWRRIGCEVEIVIAIFLILLFLFYVGCTVWVCMGIRRADQQ